MNDARKADLDLVLEDMENLRFEDQTLVFKNVRIGLVSRRPQTNGVHIKLGVHIGGGRSGFGDRRTNVSSLVKLGREKELLRKLMHVWAVFVMNDSSLAKSVAESSYIPEFREGSSCCKFFAFLDLSKDAVKKEALLAIRLAMKKARNNAHISLEDVANIWRELEIERIHES